MDKFHPLLGGGGLFLVGREVKILIYSSSYTYLRVHKSQLFVSTSLQVDVIFLIADIYIIHFSTLFPAEYQYTAQAQCMIMGGVNE